MSWSDALIMHLSMLIMHLSIFSLWQGRSAGMGWEFWYPPKKVNFPPSHQKTWLVKKYNGKKNIINSPAHKGGYINQIHTLIDKNKTKKTNHPVLTNLWHYIPVVPSRLALQLFIKSRVHYHYSLSNKKHSFWLILKSQTLLILNSTV